jgi:hypothetical protein
VSAENSFISQIAKIKRRAALRAVHGILLNAGLIFLGIQLISLIAAMTGLTDAGSHGSWYMVSICISLSAAGLIGVVMRKNFLHVLVEIDRRLKLQDRLSTAYEYLKFKKDAEFTDLLMQDAAAALGRLNRRQLLPAGFAWRHLIFIILLLAGAALYTMDYPVSGFKSARAEQKTIERAGALLRNYTFSRIENKAGPHTGGQTAFLRKLEQFGDRLYDRSLTSDQRFAALDGTLKEVQAERTRLANELDTKLNAAGVRALSVRQIPALENLSPGRLAKLKGVLNKAPDSRIPAAVNEDIESLEKLDSLAKLLSRMMDDVKKDRDDIADSAAAAGDEIQTSQVTRGPGKDQGDPQRSTADEQIRNPDRSGPDRSAEPGSGQLQENDPAFQDDAGPRENFSASAGRAKSEGGKEPSHEIAEPTGPAMPDKMASSPVKSYLIPIRALTDIGEARLKEEDIMRTYGKAVESILQKEDMPMNYREYIKNYFLAIGLNTEENADEFK